MIEKGYKKHDFSERFVYSLILLSYFMEMSDADIAREMNLVRSTIHEHRTRSLEILRKIMEGIADEKDV